MHCSMYVRPLLFTLQPTPPISIANMLITIPLTSPTASCLKMPTAQTYGKKTCTYSRGSKPMLPRDPTRRHRAMLTNPHLLVESLPILPLPIYRSRPSSANNSNLPTKPFLIQPLIPVTKTSSGLPSSVMLVSRHLHDTCTGLPGTGVCRAVSSDSYVLRRSCLPYMRPYVARPCQGCPT